MQAVPLLKPVSAQGRIATQVLNLKVSESKKRIRLQDREDVAMEEENGSSTSQECVEEPCAEGSDNRVNKTKKLK